MGEKVETKNEVKNAAAEVVEKAAPAAKVVEKAAVVEGGEKKDEASTTVVVLKLDLHCEGCAKKVRRSVAHLEGVVTVKADCDAKKLTVTGNVDPTWLRDKVEAKTKKKVELISPHPKHEGGGTGAEEKKKKKVEEEELEKKKPQDSEKTKEAAAVSTVIMKTKLHCDGCAQKIRRIIIKNFDGVDSVDTDLQKNMITVIGKTDAKELITYLTEKLKRGVEIVPPPKKDDAAAGEKPKEKDNGSGGEKKEKEEREKEADTKMEMSKMEHQSNYNPETHYAMPMVMHQDYGMYHHQSYMNPGPPLPPPTYVNMNDNMFSDENPNGCHIM